MILYVESNFPLEIALGQEEAEHADELLRLAEQGHIELAIPSFSLSEPFTTIVNRDRTTERVRALLAERLRQWRRSTPHQQVVSALEHVPDMLADIGKREIELLEGTIERVLAAGRVIDTDVDAFRLAVQNRARYGLESLDAIILTTVMADLRSRTDAEAKSFISRNWRDFEDPDILDELKQHGCVFFDSFKVALDYVRDALLGTEPGAR